MCKTTAYNNIGISAAVERKAQHRKSTKQKWMCPQPDAPNTRLFNAQIWAHTFRAEYFSISISMCVFQYIGHLYPSPQPLPLTSNNSSPSSASLLQHCSLTGWGSVLSHQQQNCRSLSGPAIHLLVFSTRVITVLLSPSPQATGPAGHRWCDTISSDICSLSLVHISKWPIWFVAPE